MSLIHQNLQLHILTTRQTPRFCDVNRKTWEELLVHSNCYTNVLMLHPFLFYMSSRVYQWCRLKDMGSYLSWLNVPHMWFGWGWGQRFHTLTKLGKHLRGNRPLRKLLNDNYLPPPHLHASIVATCMMVIHALFKL